LNLQRISLDYNKPYFYNIQLPAGQVFFKLPMLLLKTIFPQHILKTAAMFDFSAKIVAYRNDFFN